MSILDDIELLRQLTYGTARANRAKENVIAELLRRMPVKPRIKPCRAEISHERATEILAVMEGHGDPRAYRQPWPFGVNRDEIRALAEAYLERDDE